MDRVRVYAGLDYHMKSVQVCVMDAEGKRLSNKACANDAAAIRQHIEQYGQRCFVALEACTGAANLAEELKAFPSWTVNLAHPFYVSRLKKSLDKTDKQDAEVLADLQRVGYLPKVWLAPEWLRDWRWVVRHRQQLVKDQTKAKLRITAMLREARVVPPKMNPWTKAWLVWVKQAPGLGENARWMIGRHLAELARLKREISEVEQQLQKWVESDAIIQKLMTYSGVGLVTATVLRAEIGEFDRFRTGKQLARFIGLSPRNVSSGDRQSEAGIIKAGNGELRAMLIQLAHRLKRYHARWRQLAEVMKKKGKPGCVIAAAVANRWVRWLHYDLLKKPAEPTVTA
jgi:transposase